MWDRAASYQPTEGAQRIRRFLRGDDPALRALIVATHPDDETVGMGGTLPSLRNATIMHVTDGAPRDLAFARHAGCADRASYAEVRRGELAHALAMADVESGRWLRLGFVDQEASFAMVEIARVLAASIRSLDPAIVITHPYEGGHPDHDAVAFATHAARRLVARTGAWPPILVEMACYHRVGSGPFCTQRFLPASGVIEFETRLCESRRQLKRRMLQAFRSQSDVLAPFGTKVERFRVAPAYDFERPPHEGRLYYEGHGWPMTGARWRGLAVEAKAKLGLPCRGPRPAGRDGRSRGTSGLA